MRDDRETTILAALGYLVVIRMCVSRTDRLDERIGKNIKRILIVPDERFSLRALNAPESSRPSRSSRCGLPVQAVVNTVRAVWKVLAPLQSNGCLCRPSAHIPDPGGAGKRKPRSTLTTTPDFAELLQSIPENQRTGPVFQPIAMTGRVCRQGSYVGKVISSIGHLAAVRVDTDPKSAKVKYASAHDLRLAFGARWAHRIMTTVLQQLMRHESIDTTLKYYVGQNAEGVADAVWKAVELPASVNTEVSSLSGSASKKPQPQSR